MFKKLLLLLLLFLSSCGTSSTPSHYQLRMNLCREPTTVDPRAGGDFVSSTLHFLLFEGLMRLEADGSVSPAQAASVDISDDQLTYTFHLRPCLWSDGSVVTSHDFENGWKAALSPQFAAPNAHLLYAIRNGEKVKKGLLSPDALGIETPDDCTVVVHLERKAPYFLQLIAFCTFFPLSPNPATYNGPFCLKHWKHSDHILLEKNPLYWDSRSIELNQIVMNMIGDEHTALLLFEKGQLDILGRSSSPLPLEGAYKYHQLGSLKLHPFPGTTGLSFNTHTFPFHNLHIRKAFSLAINRLEIVQNITSLGEHPATNINPFSPHSLFAPHDPILAQYHFQLGLEELNLSLDSFPEIILSYSPSDLNQKLGQVLQEAWKTSLGIHVQLSSCDHKILLDKLSSKSYLVALTSWMAQYNDPLAILERFKLQDNPKNYPGWEHPDYIHFLNLSSEASTPEIRTQLLSQAESLLIQEMPIAPLYHWSSPFLIQDHLSYPDLAPGGAFDYARLKVKS